MPDKLPPRTEDGIFALTASSDIDAPADKVWEVLLDFASYPEWNSAVQSQTVVDSSGHPHASQVASEGSLVHVRVYITPSAELKKQASAADLVVTFLDNVTHRLAWESRTLPSWLLRTERWQWLTVLDGGKTRYESLEVFNGPVAWVMKWVLGANLRVGFQTMADRLKERAESTVRD